jgi:hypothetical protein
MTEIKQYKDLTNTIKNIGVKVLTVKKENLDFLKEWYLTYKLDGERKLMMITEYSVYLISQKMIFEEKKFTKKTLELAGSLIDGEYYNGRFYAFDVTHYRGLDIRDKKLSERIEILNDINDVIKSKKFKIKRYLESFDTKKLCKNFNKLVKFSKENVDHVDGVIFTENNTYQTRPLKWKSLITIDFKISKKDGKFNLVLDNGSNFSPRTHPGIGKVQVPKEIYNSYPDNSIVEFYFENDKFKVLKLRPDKIKGNHISVILDNFSQVLKGVDFSKYICDKVKKRVS